MKFCGYSAVYKRCALAINSQGQHELATTRSYLSAELGSRREPGQAVNQPLGGLVGIVLVWAAGNDFATTLCLESLSRFKDGRWVNHEQVLRPRNNWGYLAPHCVALAVG
jgi:hypothetical protein